MKRKPTTVAFTYAEMDDMRDKAKGLFLTLVGLTSSPIEAAEIIAMMHLLLWMNYGQADSVDTMLDFYVKSFKENFAEQAELHRQEAN